MISLQILYVMHGHVFVWSNFHASIPSLKLAMGITTSLQVKFCICMHVLLYDGNYTSEKNKKVCFFVRIGQEMLMEEDYMDDEIENELAPIAVQLAYIQQVNMLSLVIF